MLGLLTCTCRCHKSGSGMRRAKCRLMQFSTFSWADCHSTSVLGDTAAMHGKLGYIAGAKRLRG